MKKIVLLTIVFLAGCDADFDQSSEVRNDAKLDAEVFVETMGHALQRDSVGDVTAYYLYDDLSASLEEVLATHPAPEIMIESERTRNYAWKGRAGEGYVEMAYKSHIENYQYPPTSKVYEVRAYGKLFNVTQEVIYSSYAEDTLLDDAMLRITVSKEGIIIPNQYGEDTVYIIGCRSWYTNPSEYLKSKRLMVDDQEIGIAFTIGDGCNGSRGEDIVAFLVMPESDEENFQFSKINLISWRTFPKGTNDINLMWLENKLLALDKFNYAEQDNGGATDTVKSVFRLDQSKLADNLEACKKEALESESEAIFDVVSAWEKSNWVRLFELAPPRSERDFEKENEKILDQVTCKYSFIPMDGYGLMRMPFMVPYKN